MHCICMHFERERTGPFYNIPRVMSLMRVKAGFVDIPTAVLLPCNSPDYIIKDSIQFNSTDFLFDFLYWIQQG